MATIDWEKKGNNIPKEQKTLALQKIKEALAGLSLIAKKEILDELQKRTSAEIKAKKEAEQEIKYAALRPVGLTHASQNTQDYRKRLEDRVRQWDKEAIKDMEFFQWKFSYNMDGTVNLIKLDKTFCPDLRGKFRERNWTDAKEFTASKSYHLLTDWNDSDKQEDKEKTDWYKLEQYFGEYAKTWDITYILGCVPDRYWTGTEYEGKEGVARIRRLNYNGCCRNWGSTDNYYCICGIKDMNVTA